MDARRWWIASAVALVAWLMASAMPAAAAGVHAHRFKRPAAHRCHRSHRKHSRKRHACVGRRHRHAHRLRAVQASKRARPRHGLTPGSPAQHPYVPAPSTTPAGGTTTVVGTTGASQPAAPPPSTTTTSPAPAGAPSIYWGAYLGDQFTGGHPPWDWNAQTAFQAQDAGGKAASLVPFGAPFYSTQWCGGDCTFPTSMFDRVRAAGMIPWFTWQTTSDYTDAQIAAGAEDSYITAWAQAAKTWGHPFFLRFDWEMNGNWFPWGVGANGNTASSYVAMWRHVHDIFTTTGATNVTWVWCPNIDTPPSTYTPLRDLYPGSSYVDWTALDAYNGDVPWTSFQNLISSTYNQITAMAPGKPMVVGETGSTETGGSKAAWITNLLTTLPSSFPQIHGLLWYDISSAGPGGHSDWPLETSASAQAAFSAGIQAPVYASNGYASLSAAPIPPPS